MCDEDLCHAFGAALAMLRLLLFFVAAVARHA